MAVVHHQKMGQHQRYDDIGLLSLSRWVMSQLADLYFQRKVAEVSVDQGHARIQLRSATLAYAA